MVNMRKWGSHKKKPGGTALKLLYLVQENGLKVVVERDNKNIAKLSPFYRFLLKKYR